MAGRAAADDESQDAGLQEVVVTGSRIARQDYVAQSPIVTTSVESVQNSGVPTVDAYLLQLPQFQPGTGGFTNVSSGGLGVGQATLNLRGLGSVRTLVLLDGRRLQPGNAQSLIDINTIPTSAISDVEVMTGGASATYGSDAMAGVVNFKLRKTYTGSGALRADRTKRPRRCDDAPGLGHRRYRLCRRGRLGHVRRGVCGPRADQFPRSGVLHADGQPGGLARQRLLRADRIQSADSSRREHGIRLLRRRCRRGSANRKLRRQSRWHVVPQRCSRAPTTGPTAMPASSRTAPPVLVTTAIARTICRMGCDVVPGLLRAQYELSPQVTLFAQGLFAHSFARGQGSHPQATPFGAAGLTVPVTNPFIPADLQRAACDQDHPWGELHLPQAHRAGWTRAASRPPRIPTRPCVGAEGKLGGDWSFDAYYSHGNTSPTDKSVAGSVSISALQQLLSAPDGGASLCAGGYNVFGPQPSSASCAAYISRRTVTTHRHHTG